MIALVVVVAVAFGLALGSFANVVIYRVPRGLSVVNPPSACPSCGAFIKRRHNVPVFGWIALRGRCASCGGSISRRYPIIEASVGAGFGVISAVWGLTWTTVILLCAAWTAVVLSAIDLDVRRLPRAIVMPWAAVTAVLIAAAAVEHGDVWLLVRAAIGAASLGLLYAISFFVYPNGLGWGDVTVAPVLGGVLAYMGWGEMVVGGFAAFVWGMMGAVVPMIKARAIRGVSVPFGPSMFLGAATGIAVGAPIAHWYTSQVLGL